MKTFILDTCVLLADSRSMYAFEENEVILPFTALEELDKIKTRPNEVGANARECVRQLSELIAQNDTGALRTGVSIKSGGTLRVAAVSDFILTDLGVDWEAANKDNHILNVCRGIAKQHKDDGKEPPILVTRDILLRVKCDFLGIPCEDYKNARVISDADGIYSGVKHIEATEENIQDYWECEKNPGKELCLSLDEEVVGSLVPNQFLILHDPNSTSQPIVRYVDKNKSLKVIHPTRNTVYGLTPRNREQHLALDLLLDTEIKLVTLLGTSGGGKTLISLASGLEQVIEKKIYKTLLICRPIVPVGNDLGYMPGPQPLDAKILTPFGWTTMGQLKVGSEVISRDGKPTKVLKIFPKGKKLVYKLSTSDGGSTECCEDHLWFTKTAENRKRQKEGSVKTTREIINSFVTEKEKFNHFLPKNEAIHFNKTELPLSPYTLGVILGDGSVSGHIDIASSKQDSKEVIERVRREILSLGCSITPPKNGISYSMRANERPNNKPAKPVKITNLDSGEVQVFSRIGEAWPILGVNKSTVNYRCTRGSIIGNYKYEFLPCLSRWQNPVKEILHNLGLSGTKAWTKFIPEQYLYRSSVEDRISLLQGLMDTDGTIKKNGEASFATTSKKLADGLIELVYSLGGRARLRARDRRRDTHPNINGREIITRRISYEFTISLPKEINPFFLSRKAKRHHCSYIYQPSIVSIKPSGVKEVQCILVDNPEHLYITDDFIVTHNTREEKLDPWMGAIKDNLKQLLFSGRKTRYNEMTFDQFIEEGVIEMEAITYLRGRSITDTFMLIDECFPYGQHINTENGKMAIGKLVSLFSKNLPVPKVLAYDNKNQTFVYKKIVNAWQNGKKPLISVGISNRVIHCTENHPFLLLDKGYVKASDLEKGDLVMSTKPTPRSQLLKVWNTDQEQVVLGSYLGDGSVACHGLNRFRVKVIHGTKQKRYCEHKAGILNCSTREITKNGYAQTPATSFSSLMFGSKFNFSPGKKSCDQSILDKLTIKGLAVWFMDDGSAAPGKNGARLSTCSFDENTQKRFVSYFHSLGMKEVYYTSYFSKSRNKSYWYLNFKSKDYKLLSSLIEPYVHPDLAYKVINTGLIDSYKWNTKDLEYGVSVVDSIDLDTKIVKDVFDLEVEDLHNFVVCSTKASKNNSGIVVHNCQNLSAHELKTIITRVGENTKIILAGDIFQIDEPHLDAVSNGLTIAIEKFKSYPISGHVQLTKGIRSELSALAAEIL